MQGKGHSKWCDDNLELFVTDKIEVITTSKVVVVLLLHCQWPNSDWQVIARVLQQKNMITEKCNIFESR